MDEDLVLIFSFVIVITTLCFWLGSNFHRRSIAHKERSLELEARIAEARAMEARAGAMGDETLEGRIRVLERIATDKDGDLAAQIEDLRDREPEQKEAV